MYMDINSCYDDQDIGELNSKHVLHGSWPRVRDVHYDHVLCVYTVLSIQCTGFLEEGF